jgi:hypothetical protein
MDNARIVEIDISLWNIIKLTFKFMVALILVTWIPLLFSMVIIGVLFQEAVNNYFL